MSAPARAPQDPANRGPRPRPLFAYILAASIVLVDQASKIVVERNFDVGPWSEAYRLIRDVLYIRRTANDGGMAGIGDALPPWAFAIMAALFSLWVVGLIAKLEGTDRRYVWALASMLGGFLGNGVDRIRNGYVTDFLYVTAFPENWFSAFNVADLAIFSGLAWIGVVYIRSLFVSGEGSKTDA